MAIVDQVVDIVMFHDFVRVHVHGDLHVCIIFGFHGCAQIKIFHIAIVYVALGVEMMPLKSILTEAGSFCVDITGKVYMLATSCPPHLVWGFFWG